VAFDLGTGFRVWGETFVPNGPVHATVLLTHLHFDHVQGLPFFEPVDREGARLDVFGPQPAETDLDDAFAGLIQPPYFPLRSADRRGEIRFHDVDNEQFSLGEAAVTVRSVPHLGPTNGYRVEWEGVSLAYVSDHQAPEGLDRVPDSVLELAEGVDLLIHDAQFTDSEWRQKSDWGHSTVDFAVLVAREAGARRLALFHHDPAHDDDMLDRLVEQARRTGDRLGVDEVLGAAEGLTLSLPRHG
jgi:ribonuclease BN (tRNA processing enzyme)